MAFAARDPFYLATFAEELTVTSAKDQVERACTRCHAPAASLEHEQQGGHTSFAELTADSSVFGSLAREGVGCSLCHQIAAAGLGEGESFGGGFRVGFDREMFGPFQDPATDPMEFFVDFTPSYGAHITDSALCGSCHTVLTPVLGADGAPTGGDFLEQASFLEWRNSAAAEEGSCSDCHLPSREPDGSALTTAIARYPEALPDRAPYGRHTFVGANAYVLSLLADNVEWSGTDVPKAEIVASAGRSELHLSEAASLTVVDHDLSPTQLTMTVEVRNRAGHKLPTGYPTRRVWLHVRAEDEAGAVLFESGGFDERGAIVDASGVPLDTSAPWPHRDVVDAPDQVQVYEAVAVDAQGALAKRPLAAATYAKDNRILPFGWRDDDTWIDWIDPVGVGDDPSFVGGSDRTTFVIPAAGVRTVQVELLYQTVSREQLDHLTHVATPASSRLAEMVERRAPLPLRIAATTLDLP